MVNESYFKPIKLWVDRGKEFYNKVMQELLDNNDILIHSTHDEGRSVIAEKIYKKIKGIFKIYKKLKIYKK